jgi:glycosyltransferase involved in cell wall biosynthesis
MGTMKVAVIAAEMEGHATGVGRYLEGLLSGLRQWNHGVDWHLFFQGAESSSPFQPDGPFHAHFSDHQGSRVVWEQTVASRAIAEVGADVVFGPAYTLPFGLRAPSLVTLHDLSFEVLPQEFGFRERWRRRLLARRAARVADRVLTVSEHMADLLAERYLVARDRISVVPHGIDSDRFSAISRDEDAAHLAELGIRKPYLLWAGTVLERRLPRHVLEAFSIARIVNPELVLIIAGANRMRRPERLQRWINEFGLQGAVRELGWVEERALAALYRGAEIGVYVSCHEGFGLPPIECLACGTPVIVSPGLGLDDAWPDYPFRVPELRVEAVAEMMASLLDASGAAAATVADAPAKLSGFDWEQSSRRLVAEIDRLVPP